MDMILQKLGPLMFVLMFTGSVMLSTILISVGMIPLKIVGTCGIIGISVLLYLIIDDWLSVFT